MKNLAFRSSLRWKIILPILTTSVINLALRGWENTLFELGSERAKQKQYSPRCMSSALYTRVIIDVDEAAIIQAIKIESPVATPHFVSRPDGARYYITILKGRETAGGIKPAGGRRPNTELCAVGILVKRSLFSGSQFARIITSMLLWNPPGIRPKHEAIMKQ